MTWCVVLTSDLCLVIIAAVSCGQFASTDDSEVAQGLLVDRRDEVIVLTMRRQQMEACVLLGNMTHEMVKGQMTSEAVRPEETMSIRSNAETYRQTLSDLENLAGQQATLCRPGKVNETEL